MSELKLLASRSRAAVIAVSETWLDESVTEAEIGVPGYQTTRKDRDRHGGGVCLYIRSDLAFNTRPDLLRDELECVWIELLLPKTKPLLVGACYRPPTQSDYFRLLEDTLSSSENVMKETFLLGDFNTNVLSAGKVKKDLLSSFKSLLRIFDMCQLVTQPTRVTANSETCIDLIIVSDPEKITQSGVIPTGLSDHYLTFCTRKISRGAFSSHNTVKIRSMRNYNASHFQELLSNGNWSDVIDSNDVDQAWFSFKNIFLAILGTVAPIKQIRIKQRTEQWMSSEILDSIRARDHALIEFRKHKSPEHYKTFCSLRNSTQRMIKKAKQSYYRDAIEQHKSCPGKLWDCLKSIGLKGTRESTSVGLNLNDQMHFDGPTVADSFNDYFSTIAGNLVSKLPSSSLTKVNTATQTFYAEKGVIPGSFSFSVVGEGEVLKILLGIGRKKATGLDSLPARFISDGSRQIAWPLTHIINLSIHLSKVPREFKLARIVPLHKKNCKTEVGNYRPVSILPVISKVLERVVYNQFETYLSDHSLLYQFQSGFRAGYSTDSCLIHLTDYIRLQVDGGKYAGMVLLDLQKAFDTVNHDILLMKLDALGLDDRAVAWFRSYLAERNQRVYINGTLSSQRGIECGVPQGSILGPLLFLAYVNDMERAVNCRLLLYADDSALLVSGKSAEDITTKLSRELQSVKNWLVDNRLSLHLGKTESKLFGSPKQLKKNRL